MHGSVPLAIRVQDKPCQFKVFITCQCQRIKQESRCNVTKGSERNLSKSLKCDDECARLERNRQLALALNIDPATHKDDHIPYSAETLNLFQQNVTWAQAQEKELRTFAANPDQKKLRFKPMPSHQRAFLHALAEDFGLDSESMDPEAHRHVAIFKTPRFVMAPMKTLAECVRIRHNQRVATAAAANEGAKKLRASNVVADPYNAFLLTDPRFALTVEELRSAIKPVLTSGSNITLEISFLPSEEVVLKAVPQVPSTERDIQQTLTELKPSLAKTISPHGLGKVQLCRVDASLNILRYEADSASNGGWSQVAAKAAAPNRVPVQPPVGTKSSFTVLSSATAKKKKAAEKKVEEQAVVDDWEVAEIMEEERERAEASGISAGEESGTELAGVSGQLEGLERNAEEPGVGSAASA